MTTSGLLRISILVATLSINFSTGDEGHHHVIIHVPYKIHTVHHTITKHVHHHDNNAGDKYEFIGYTVGKPIKVGQHFANGHEPMLMPHHDFGGNDLDNGNTWVPSHEHVELTNGGHGRKGDNVNLNVNTGLVHEFIEHGDDTYNNYD